MSKERTALYRDVFSREPRAETDCAGQAGEAGAAALHAAGASSSGSVRDRRALIEGLRKDIEAMEKALPPKFTYVHGVRDVEKPSRTSSPPARQPDAARRHGAARVPRRC